MVGICLLASSVPPSGPPSRSSSRQSDQAPRSCTRTWTATPSAEPPGLLGRQLTPAAVNRPVLMGAVNTAGRTAGSTRLAPPASDPLDPFVVEAGSTAAGELRRPLSLTPPIGVRCTDGFTGCGA